MVPSAILSLISNQEQTALVYRMAGLSYRGKNATAHNKSGGEEDDDKLPLALRDQLRIPVPLLSSEDSDNSEAEVADLEEVSPSSPRLFSNSNSNSLVGGAFSTTSRTLNVSKAGTEQERGKRSLAPSPEERSKRTRAGPQAASPNPSSVGTLKSAFDASQTSTIVKPSNGSPFMSDIFLDITRSVLQSSPDRKHPFELAKQLSSLSVVRTLGGADVPRMFSLVNDPRNKYISLLTVKRLGNVVGGRPVTYVNVDITPMKKAAIAMLKAGLPVFFGSDVGKFSNSRPRIMDPELYNCGLAFNISLILSKSQRLKVKESSMTHAMVLTAM
jgi:hypothetical protein